MAEFVEQKIQEMIPEMEEMERLELLSSQEIKKLIEKRRDFEYRVSRRLKLKEDFVSYVLFESKLLECISLRRHIISMSMNFQQIEWNISRRVMKRLRFMSRIWPSHSDIWELRISFSKSQKFFDEVSTAYAERIRFHGNDEDVWVKWAQWEIEGRNNFQKARSILLSKAVLYHAESLILTREYFRLELLYVEFLKNLSQQKNIEGLEEIALENRAKILSCALPETIYANACKRFDTPHMYLQFYFVAEKFEFAKKLQKQIYRDALSKYPNEEVIYKLQAKRKLSGISSEPSDEESEDEVLELCPKKNLMGLFEIYDKAVDSIGEAFMKNYFEELLDLLYQCWGLEEYSTIIVNKLFNLFEKKISNVLSSSYFIIWYLIAVHLKKPNSALKRILFAAKAAYPNCPAIKLHWIKFRHTLKPHLVYNQKNFLEGVSGQIGVKLCMALINNKGTKEAYKGKLFKKAAFHTDATVAKFMRINQIEYLTDDDGAMKDIRTLYKEYCYLPPFSVDLHVCMIMKELSCKKVLLNQVRHIFEVAVKQFGQSHIGVWLSFIEFERKFGNNENISNLHQQAQENLDVNLFQNFIDLKFYLQNRKTKSTNDENKILVGYESQEEDIKEVFWSDSALGSIFVEPPILTYSAIAERKNLFLSLAEAVSVREEKNLKIRNDEKGWEKLLTFLLGEPIHLKVKKVDVGASLQNDTKEFLEKSEREFEKKISKRGAKLSEKLLTSSTPAPSAAGSDVQLEKILESSLTLQPDFLKQTQLIPYYLNIKTKKKMRKIKRAETKGEGWFNMKAPEITPEVKRDLAILKMRSVLHPDRHYKRNDMKEMPKYFQLGKVVDSPVDFYSSRIPKKERKRTFAEEIMNEEEVIRYQKRKYIEIIGQRVQRKRKRSEALKSENMKKLNKSKEKRASKVKPKNVKKRKTFKYTQD